MKSIEQVRTPELIAMEIRGYTAMMLTNVIEIGRRMCEVKELLPHGSFGNWIKENTGYSISTANNFMRLFNEYADDQFSLFGAEVKSQTLGNLGYTKALELLALPPSEREEFIETHDVEDMSTRELKDAIRELEEARKRAEDAERENAELESRVEELTEVRDNIANALNIATAELEEARNKPIEAAVTATDPAEVEKAVEEALAKAAEEHAAEMDKMIEKLNAAAKANEKLEKKLLNAKNAATEADRKAASGSEVYKAAAEHAKAEVERLRRELAMADPVTAEFKGLFEQASVIVTKLVRLVGEAPESSAPNLKAALAALGKQLGG